ncbi:MAG: hypothetical protein QW165_00640 [Candidatus Woesearchaeota archaeon]
MKVVDVDFKKIDIVDYYSQLDQVKIRVLFNDGKEKALVRQMSITDPGKQALEIISEIRTKLKEQHREHSLDDHPLAGALILRFRQEEEQVHEKTARFLAQAREKIRSGKLAKLSYADLEKKVVGFSYSFN